MGLLTFLVCICIVVCLGFSLGLKFCPLLKCQYSLDFLETGIFYLALLMGAGILCLNSFLPFSSFVVIGLGGLAVLGLSTCSLTKKGQLSLFFLLCFLSTLYLYPFPNHFLRIIFLSLFWAFSWGIFVFFDRFPFMSSLVSLSWALGLFCVGLISAKIPEMIVVQVGLLASLTTIFSRFQLSRGNLMLGKNMACFVGFLWASIWTYFISTGAILSTFVSFGYYLFEGIVLLFAFILHRLMIPFGARLMLQPQFSSKAIGIVFLHLLLLSFLSALSMYSVSGISSVLIFVLAIVLIDLYLRLDALVHPIPTWREMFHNTKEGMLALKKEFSSRKAISDRKQKKSVARPVKKVVSKKTSTKKRKKKK